MAASFIRVVLRETPDMIPDVIRYHRHDIDCNHATTACRTCMRDWRNDYRIIG